MHAPAAIIGGVSHYVRPCLCLLAAARLLSAADVHDEAVSLLQMTAELSPGSDDDLQTTALKYALHTYPKTPVKYETIESALTSLGGSQAGADPLHVYRKVGEELGRAQAEELEKFDVPSTVHSRQILKYVSTLKDAPKLAAGGCLYLPSDRAWKAFYGHLEHPYPPKFAEMVANAFYPDCNGTSVSGVTMQKCADGTNVRGAEGCVQVKLIGDGGHVKIFATEGHIGLPFSWSTHVRQKRAQLSAGEVGHSMPVDSCSISTNGPLKPVPKNKRMVLPTRVIMCISQDRQLPSGIERLVKEQIQYTNQGYSGNNPYARMAFDSEMPPKTDMQIEFDLKAVEVQRDDRCATQTFGDLGNAAQHNANGSAWFTIILVADDETGVLGMSTFPTERSEASSQLLVAISVRGLRRWTEFSGEQWDDNYKEGHTMTHEVGHALGIFHTFEGGCSAGGDEVDDTEPEAYPHYTCSAGESCGSEDPIHNFMDYVPDQCMAGFTEQQKRRAWCIMEKYRPTLFNLAVRDQKDHWISQKPLQSFG